MLGHTRPARGSARSAAGSVAAGLLILAVASCPAVAEGEYEIAPSMMPFTIVAAGLYAATADLVGVAGSPGIQVAADNVTIDLKGFALRGTAGSGSGIALLGPHSNLVVRNGTIAGWGGDGVSAVLATNSLFASLTFSHNATNGINSGFCSRVSDCIAFRNGNIGIEVENGSTVERCVAYANAQHGLDIHSASTVRDSTTVTNGHDGIHGSFNATVERCAARDNMASGDGIEVDAGSVVRGCVTVGNEDGIKVRGGGGLIVDCVSTGNRDDGVDVDGGSTVLRCMAARNGGHGIRVADACAARDNTAQGNGKAGVKAAGSGNRVEGNALFENEYGVRLDTNGNFIAGNSAAGNTKGDYQIPTGNHYQKATLSGTDIPDSPWVNLSY